MKVRKNLILVGESMIGVKSSMLVIGQGKTKMIKSFLMENTNMS